ncbi:MAG: Phosphoserine phosphatase 1 [Phycisphaerae bacterium]|nr:Phosphoserine phosphatase 1 [Phycisphaerae bacterium]
MTTLYIVRHGQTAWNRDKVFRGSIDVPLSEVGVEQARAAARRLADVPLAACYASPMGRARETARLIAAPHGLEVAVEPGLMDLNNGQWEGKTERDVAAEWPDLSALWRSRPHEVQFPGGESLAVVRDRSSEAVVRLAARHEGESILLVSHRAPCRLICCTLLGLDATHFAAVRQDNACIDIFQRDATGRWVVRLLNGVDHLRDVKGGLLADDF